MLSNLLGAPLTVNVTLIRTQEEISKSHVEVLKNLWRTGYFLQSNGEPCHCLGWSFSILGTLITWKKPLLLQRGVCGLPSNLIHKM